MSLVEANYAITCIICFLFEIIKAKIIDIYKLLLIFAKSIRQIFS